MCAKTKELSWSLTKARMFHQCPRRYYYHYHLSDDGYYPDAPEESRLAFEMKGVKGLDMWVGEVVHETIEWVLTGVRDGEVPDPEAARLHARDLLSSGWQASLRRLWRTHPRDGHPNLFEHYYGLPNNPATTERLKRKAFTCVANFMDSPLLEQIASTNPSAWLPIEKYAAFRLDGILCYVKFDFAMRRPNGSLAVYDWKTGKPSEEEGRQLACYATYASGKWNVPLDDIRVTAVHLQPELDAPEMQLGEEDIDDVRSYARASFNAILARIRDPARRVAAMDDFPMTGNLLWCVRCCFRGICIQGKLAAGETPDEYAPDCEEC